MEKHGTSLEVNFSMSYDWHQVPFEHFKLYTCTQRQIYLFPPLSLVQSLELQCLAPSSGAPAFENHPNLVLHQSTSVPLSSIIDLFVYFCRAAHIAYEAEQWERWRPVGSLNSTRRPVLVIRKNEWDFPGWIVYGLRWVRRNRMFWKRSQKKFVFLPELHYYFYLCSAFKKYILKEKTQ